MKRLIPLSILLQLVLLVGCASSKQEVSLAARLDPLLHKYDSKGVVYAARVIDLQEDRVIYEHRATEPMIPASNMKLFTTAAALARFSPEYQFETFLVKRGDDLLIIGTGDPSTGDGKIARQRDEKPTAIFDRWADALKVNGFTQIPGRLLFFDGSFDRELVLPAWSKSFLTDWYAAPVSGLNFNDNCIDVVATPSQPGAAATIDVMPPTSIATIKNETKTSDTGAPKIDREQDANVFTISGAVSKRTELESKPVTDPGLFFADALRTHLQSKGITITGETVRLDKLPEGEKVKLIAVNRSPMPEVINRLNKASQNLFAEAFAKLLGLDYNRRNGSKAPGSWESGAKATHEFLRSQRIDDASFVMVDGSGLSRQNKVTAMLVSDLLRVMHYHAYGKAYRDSLGRAGEDGTIGKRMLDLKGHIWAKTGYIGGVRALSGYALTREGKWLAFSFIYNQIPGSVKPFEELQDDACRLLVEYPNVDRASLKSATQPSTAPTTQAK
jgi:D-alanyl-D-alanine carboxypeptidase/D-alanyl-D-alanine-endopeptidase (penicillin-binding protein 4)